MWQMYSTTEVAGAGSHIDKEVQSLIDEKMTQIAARAKGEVFLPHQLVFSAKSVCIYMCAMWRPDVLETSREGIWIILGSRGMEALKP
eukprot:4693588-Amphidinium_carterae.1